ncbi:hypothetical protein Agub_g9383, partial [Astrephomene gubernaculifera]
MAESAQDVRRMALAVLHSRLMDGRQLVDEFRAVIARDQDIQHTFRAAQSPANTPKNRYVNVLPYDYNRVLLQSSSHNSAPNGAAASSATGRRSGSGTGEQPPFPSSSSSASSTPHAPSDYINASHVIHEDDQCDFSVAYIACQGPLAATVPDFWRMCWTEGVGAVVMLTNTVERGVTKCAPYYPTQPGTRLVLRNPTGAAVAGTTATASATGSTSYGPRSSSSQHHQQQHQTDGRIAASAASASAGPQEVLVQSCRSLLGGDLTHTQLQMLPYNTLHDNNGGNSSDAAAAATGTVPPRGVAHLRYNAWPDHGTPSDAGAIRAMCDMLRPIEAAGGAVVVHCSAGIGRTGTFCAIDILRRRLEHLQKEAEVRPGSVRQDDVHAALNLPELVQSLRRQRGGMVQTMEQYAFCYQAVFEELTEAGLEGLV